LYKHHLLYKAVGLSADAARETITQFGNAVARAGGGAEQFDGVVLALSQISAVGKVTQEDLNQIKERLPEFATSDERGVWCSNCRRN
jgi:phage tail tape-measure protein